MKTTCHSRAGGNPVPPRRIADLRLLWLRSWIPAYAGMTVLAGSVMAQAVFKHVGSDGRVTYSDRPPSNAAKDAPVVTATTRGGGTLPYALAQVASKYPVTLYTTTNCTPCAQGRSLLQQRGIPFSEKTVTSAEDQNALQKISGDTQLPFATIGTQQLKGFSTQEWVQYLDAANYPVASALPKNYRNSEPSPLVTTVRLAVPATAEATRSTLAPARERRGDTDRPDPRNNPAGIKF